ncbi:hypothetical protein BV20DRAFT_1105070 [Pilatotrama ljubarskyi]|nr:hypothetical protein BV20DRAFT_1105070 [Pilatotrama ljubarskyi]
MRLLNTFTGQFEWIEDPAKVRYAILSHTWSSKGEQSYQDVLKLQEAAQVRTIGVATTSIRAEAHPVSDSSAISSKIKSVCKTACNRDYHFIWIDSCCIDKASSAELSEAINSMFLWYTLADVCFVYLEDVPPSPDGPQTGEGSVFWRSRWHTRGWMLQELIAPAYIWHITAIGSKTELASALAERTSIDAPVLIHMVPLHRASVTDRM